MTNLADQTNRHRCCYVAYSLSMTISMNIKFGKIANAIGLLLIVGYIITITLISSYHVVTSRWQHQQTYCSAFTVSYSFYVSVVLNSEQIL